MREWIQGILWIVECFFILYMLGYASFLFLSVTVGSSDLYAAKRRNLLKNELANDYYLPVSVIVPAHNEGITIEATIRSLLALWTTVPPIKQPERCGKPSTCGR